MLYLLPSNAKQLGDTGYDGQDLASGSVIDAAGRRWDEVEPDGVGAGLERSDGMHRSCDPADLHEHAPDATSIGLLTGTRFRLDVPPPQSMSRPDAPRATTSFTPWGHGGSQLGDP
jgi:hypothetical protein